MTRSEQITKAIQITGMTRRGIQYRFKKGMSYEEIISTPKTGPISQIMLAAKAVGLTEGGVRTRLKAGMSLADAGKIPRFDPSKYMIDYTQTSRQFVWVVKKLHAKPHYGYLWVCKCKSCGTFFTRTSTALSRNRVMCKCRRDAILFARTKRKRKTGRSKPFIFLTFDGETKCISEWGKLWKLSYHCINSRLRQGHTDLKYLSAPSGTHVVPPSPSSKKDHPWFG